MRASAVAPEGKETGRDGDRRDGSIADTEAEITNPDGALGKIADDHAGHDDVLLIGLKIEQIGGWNHNCAAMQEERMAKVEDRQRERGHGADANDDL